MGMAIADIATMGMQHDHRVITGMVTIITRMLDGMADIITGIANDRLYPATTPGVRHDGHITVPCAALSNST
jgi:hypothetical protein